MFEKTGQSGVGAAAWLGAACGLMFSPTAVAEPPGGFEYPTVWSWDDPTLGMTISNPFPDSIIPMVRVDIKHLTAAEAALAMVDLICEYELVQGEVCILLHGFGNKTEALNQVTLNTHLQRHPGDLITLDYRGQPPLPTNLTRAMSPWMDSGLTESGDYFSAFASRLDYFLTVNNLPIPDRFHFDTERMFTAAVHGKSPALWPHIQYSPQYKEAGAVPGLGGTLEDEFNSAPMHVQEYQPASDFDATANQPWSNWVTSLGHDSLDAAMNEVAYQEILARWPSAMISNWETTLRVDGLNGRRYPQRTERGAVSGDVWYLTEHQGTAGPNFMQAPVCYVPADSYILSDPPENEDWVDAMIRLARTRIEACGFSYGGNHFDEIVPWTTNVGTHFLGWLEPVTKDALRRLYTLYQAKGIKEMLMWYCPFISEKCLDDTDASDWQESFEAFDQVWNVRQDSYDVIVGQHGPTTGDELLYSNDDGLVIDSDLYVQVETTFETQFTDPKDSLEVTVEVTPVAQTEDIILFIQFRDPSNGFFETITSETLDADSVGTRHITIKGQIDADKYIDPTTNEIEVLMMCLSETPFTVDLDLIQVVSDDT